MKEYDIVIVGGGIVGLALANLLATSTTFSIAILEANQASSATETTDYYHRVSAITLTSQMIFQSLNVWELLRQKRISPFKKISVWDDQRSEIHFSHQEIAEPCLGFIVENNLMQAVLLEKILQSPQIEFLAPVRVTAIEETNNNLILRAGDLHIKTRLAIAADGAHSWLRQAANIEIIKKDYAQTAIVATVRTKLSHQQIARQVFYEKNILAFLPLQDAHLCSIVWSLSAEEATRLLALEADLFASELNKAFAHLGNVVDVKSRQGFPLAQQQATRYVTSRIALVGDAAHTVHPLAGQGINMGLLDAASLAQILIEASQKRRDYASFATLRRYERWRKADNLTLNHGIDLLKTLFASDKKSLQTLRATGLALTNQTRFLKNLFTRHAVGKRDHLPVWLTK